MSYVFGYKPERVRQALAEVYDHRCQYCGEVIEHFRNVNLEHIEPRYSGGSNTLENFTLSCSYCNQLKDSAAKPSNIAEGATNSWRFQEKFGDTTFVEVFSPELLESVKEQARLRAPLIMERLGPRVQYTDQEVAAGRIIYRWRYDEDALQMYHELTNHPALGIAGRQGKALISVPNGGKHPRIEFSGSRTHVRKSLDVFGKKGKRRLRWLSNVHVVPDPQAVPQSADFWTTAIDTGHARKLGYFWLYTFVLLAHGHEIRDMIGTLTN